jgi:hypothetical protein
VVLVDELVCVAVVLIVKLRVGERTDEPKVDEEDVSCWDEELKTPEAKFVVLDPANDVVEDGL